MHDKWIALADSRNWHQQFVEPCWTLLDDNYGNESRHYHNWTHIEDCLNQLTELQIKDSVYLELGIWFHDVIYDTKRSDNEAESGRFAREWLHKLGEPEIMCTRVERLINITDHKTEPTDEEEKLIIDIDLSILGRDKRTYREYAEKIRSEYSFVTEDLYTRERVKVLNRFLKRSRIFQSERFHDRYESPAISNLAEEIDWLSR